MSYSKPVWAASWAQAARAGSSAHVVACILVFRSLQLHAWQPTGACCSLLDLLLCS